MGRACGTHGGEEKCLNEFGRESLEDQGVDVRMALRNRIGRCGLY